MSKLHVGKFLDAMCIDPDVINKSIAMALSDEPTDEEKIVICSFVISGNVKLLKLLIDLGSNITFTGKDGGTLLHFAAEEGQFETMELLLKSGIDPKVEDKHGHNALRVADLHGHYSGAFEVLEKHKSRIATQQ